MIAVHRALAAGGLFITLPLLVGVKGVKLLPPPSLPLSYHTAIAAQDASRNIRYIAAKRHSMASWWVILHHEGVRFLAAAPPWSITLSIAALFLIAWGYRTWRSRSRSR